MSSVFNKRRAVYPEDVLSPIPNRLPNKELLYFLGDGSIAGYSEFKTQFDEHIVATSVNNDEWIREITNGNVGGIFPECRIGSNRSTTGGGMPIQLRCW